MKTYFLFFIVLIAFAGCKKVAEQIEEDLITQAITNGHWRIANFTKGSTNLTTEFSEYKFQFQSNYTVNAIKNGSVSASGTWQPNVENRTITSNFRNAQSPLPLLNGVWTITKNSWTYVEANQTAGNEVYTLRLEKE